LGIVIKGRADLVVTDEEGRPFLLELKTINLRRYTGLLSSGIYLPDHFLQWNLYAKALEINDGLIVYENKDDQRMKVFPVQYSEEIFMECARKFKMINDYTKRDERVPIPAECDTKYCAAKNICYPK